MWLVTTIGFFSVVQKPRQTDLTVHARVADDLDRLREQYMPALSPTIIGESADAPFRALISHDAFALGLAKMASVIDYSNFPSTAAQTIGYQRAQLYTTLWEDLQEQERSRGR